MGLCLARAPPPRQRRGAAGGGVPARVAAEPAARRGAVLHAGSACARVCLCQGARQSARRAEPLADRGPSCSCLSTDVYVYVRRESGVVLGGAVHRSMFWKQAYATPTTPSDQPSQPPTLRDSSAKQALYRSFCGTSIASLIPAPGAPAPVISRRVCGTFTHKRKAGCSAGEPGLPAAGRGRREHSNG